MWEEESEECETKGECEGWEGAVWVERGCRLAVQGHKCVRWPGRVEVSVQGFHVSVQGRGWGTRSHKYVRPPT